MNDLCGPGVVALDGSASIACSGTGLEISWVSVSEARTYTLHRSVDKGVWPSPPMREGIIGLHVILLDVPFPPPALLLPRGRGELFRQAGTLTPE
ncbi:hypothetical protein ACFLU6_06965 [Acidobacteriota bacterium]